MQSLTMSNAYSILWLLLLLQPSVSKAQDVDNFIYKVSVPIPGSSSNLLQTGFLLKGKRGIVTALHGVVVGDSCSAYNKAGQVFNNLTIANVSVDQDLAILTCPEIETNEVGLVTYSGEIADKQELFAWGHPNGAALYKKPVNSSTPHVKSLNDLLDTQLRKSISSRRSPVRTIDILALDGNLGAGYSGGPLLNSQNEVVGIVDGGLSGQFAIDWAISISKIVWANGADEQGALDTLKVLGLTKGLFTFCYDKVPQPPGKPPNKPTAGKASLLPDADHVKLLENHPLTDQLLRGFSGADATDGRSGTKGRDGKKAYGRSSKGGQAGTSGDDGEPGQDGGRGGDAQSVTLIVDMVEFENYPPLLKFLIKNASNGESSLAYCETNSPPTFILTGGHGGRGGKGGDGGRGGSGSKGSDGSTAPMIQRNEAFNGGDGGNGGKGGNGASGGGGGDGGNGGNVRLLWAKPDLETAFSSEIRFVLTGGIGGIGGKGGTGGKGGEAGEEGKGTVYRNNFGYVNGTDGTSGDVGDDGSDGEPGHRGSSGKDGRRN